MKPLAIDLYCGLGGWTEALLEAGYDVIGFDIERHVYGANRYPGHLVLQDVRTLHGRQFRDAALIVASSPCQEFSYRHMPWKRAKAMPYPFLGVELFQAAFRIQIEAIEAAGRHIPMVAENVVGAQKFVGRAPWHYGSFYLWGDVPAVMPFAERARKNGGGSWFAVAHNTTSGHANNPVSVPADGVKVGGKSAVVDGHKRISDEWRSKKFAQRIAGDGVKQSGSGAEWFDRGICKHGSKSSKRKQASALIAKIPLPLARHIAQVYYPVNAG